MLSHSTKVALCELLLNVANVEKSIEIIRQLLCEFKTFHPYIAFKRIDAINKNSKGYIDANDIYMLLESNGFTGSLEECRIFIKLYDQDNDGTIQYSEFNIFKFYIIRLLRALLPAENLNLRQLVTLKQPTQLQRDDYADSQVEYTIAKLICTEIQLQIEQDNLKKALHSCYDFSPMICFSAIVGENNSKIIADDLSDFFWRNAIIVYEDEIKSMVKRIDFMADGVIDEDEFNRFLELAAPWNLQKTGRFINTPMKSSQYLSRYLQEPESSNEKKITQSNEKQKTLTNDPSYKTPPQSKIEFQKTLHSKSKSKSKISSNKQKDNFSIKKRLNDETMSNVITQSKVNFNTKIIKTMSQSPKKDNVTLKHEKTPQKYLQQKADLRAQIATQKVFSSKKQSKANNERILSSNKSVNKSLQQTSPYKKLMNESGQANSQLSTKQGSQALQQSFAQHTISPQKKGNRTDPSLIIGDVLMRVIKIESNIENCKIQLAKQPEFNLFEAFRMLDVNKFGFLTTQDLDSFMKVSKGSMQIVISNYGQNGKLRQYLENQIERFSDFIKLVQPKSPDYQQYLQEKKPLYESTLLPSDKIFQFETLQLYRDLLNLLVDAEFSVEDQKSILKNSKLSIQEAFNLLDQFSQDDILKYQDFEEFFFANQFECNLQDIYLLQLRLDLDQDGLVSKQDFINYFLK